MLIRDCAFSVTIQTLYLRDLAHVNQALEANLFATFISLCIRKMHLSDFNLPSNACPPSQA